MSKISQAPEHLRPGVALVTQRQDRMAISLRNRITMSVSLACAVLVGLNNPTVSFRMMRFQPGKQRRPKVEVDVRIVIARLLDPIVLPNDVRKSIGSVAFIVDALVPIMIRIRARLTLNLTGPGVLARWLIKVSVND